MTPIYQTIVDPNKGNCMQAAIASLFNTKLEEVPNFIEMGNEWFNNLFNFLKTVGYEYNTVLYNPKDIGYWGEDSLLKDLKNMEGVNGYFYAVVNSPKFFDPVKYLDPAQVSPTHAVIVDKDLNIVHDPNPAYKDLKQYPLHEYLGHNGVKYVYIFDKL